MKPIKVVNSLAITDNDRTNIGALRFANRTANRTAEAVGQFLNAGAQIERMPVEFRFRAGRLKRFTAADFQVFPAAFPGQADEVIFYYVGDFRIKDKRLAYIAEWETDTAPPGDHTAHLHQRYQRG